MLDEDIISDHGCVCNNSLNGNRMFCDDCILEFEDRLICSGLLEEIACTELSEDDAAEYAFRVVRVILKN